MTAAAPSTVLITGANAGVGKKVARRLAMPADTARVYVGCRNQGIHRFIPFSGAA